MKVAVQVFLKPGVLDVQGKAVEAALHGLGWSGVSDVRVGRSISFELGAADETAARQEAARMCERLLANPVIEGYRIEVSA